MKNDSAVEPGGAVIVAGYYQGNLAVGRFGVAAPALCPETPASGCKAGGGSITIANGTKPKLAWQWRGQATTVEELGSTATDDYTMCVYDESTPIPEVVYRARVTGGTQCGESTCWKTLPDGAKYRDKFGTPCGIDAITLRAGGDGAAAVAVKGRGPLLGSAGLPFASPTRVQMHASSGACWESVFSASAVQANSATKYVAKAP